MGQTRTQNGILFEFFFCENSSVNLIIINSLEFQCFTSYECESWFILLCYTSFDAHKTGGRNGFKIRNEKRT